MTRRFRTDLSAEYVRRLLDYDPKTGIFRWKERRGDTANAGTIAGNVADNGYVQIYIDGKNYRAHRLAWLCVTGAWPAHQVDHHNMIRSDNRWKNLRAATNGENLCNRLAPKNNTSGFKGVSFNKRNNKWRAYINFDKRRYELGHFGAPELAAAAYAHAAAGLHQEFARTS